VREGLALYVHWPFCVSKCPYCDFNSHVRASVDEAAHRAALLAELDYEAARTPGHRLTSIFFGGGTPSLMDPATVAEVIERARALWPAEPGIEITLEANPTSVEAARFAGFRAGGVNRVSLGLQALDDEALRFLGRPHDLATGLAALDVAQSIFPRVSFDLITARPGQSVKAWEAELARALAFGTEHLSLYQLTIEPSTRFATMFAAGQIALPDEDTALELFEITRAMTAKAGLPAYEVSNHARPGSESRHNLSYWRYDDYAGIGPGAHGRRGQVATARVKKPENWLAAVREGGHGIAEETPLPQHDLAREALLMGMRLEDGIDAARFQTRTGVAIDDALDPRGAAELEALGLIARTPDRLRLTEAGRPLLNAVLAKLAR
jgi:putative oxygen-independent coproporphyrinogen III oxidase